MIVTIDGPAGAGKSSIARQVARRIGFEFLDTGALYRAVTYDAIRSGVDLQDVRAVSQFAASVELDWRADTVWLAGVDVGDQIRTPEVTARICWIADPPPVRRRLSELQRSIATGRDLVTEGRDQGSEVFPTAECKIFLTASAEERARRRCRQLASSGNPAEFNDVLAAQNKRDAEDQARPVGALRPAGDAITIDTDRLSIDQVIDAIVDQARRIKPERSSPPRDDARA